MAGQKQKIEKRRLMPNAGHDPLARYACGIDSPVGPLTVFSDGSAITSLMWRAAVENGQSKGGGAFGPDLLSRRACQEIAAYFMGKPFCFDLPFGGFATEFSQTFAQALCRIPLGETRTYGDLATELCVSAQAIGQACGANRIPILVPCHRVLGANSLGGYSGDGGVETKVQLLRHENAAGLLI